MAAALTLGLLLGFGDGEPPIPERIHFSRDVQPILADRCYACHGPDEEAVRHDLRLDRRELAVGRAFVPGKPDDSELLRRVSSEGRDRMPPKGSKKPALSERERGILRRWIEQGAEYTAHWSFVPPRRPPVPEVAEFTQPIDRFLVARLRAEGLERSERADPRTLVRRLFLDLWGLPPDPAVVEDFVADPSPAAFDALVDQLLESPHHGERMAVHWLDLVRYADSAGYHSDPEVPVAPYRDWVIQAFHQGMPFDRFTLEQLAGDLLPDATEQQRVASGYHRLNKTTDEGGAQAGEYLAKSMADRVRTTASTWLGATLGCAECHDHKFDPYTTRDFYAFGALFADLDERGVYPNGRRPPELEVANGGRTLVATPKAPRAVRVLPRGNWLDDSGEVVSPAIPEFLGTLPVDGDRATRADLARWLVSPDNPLTARVFANRLWRMFFGKGISARLDDLGSQGEWPVHPELLDWLAVEFVESGWDVKHLVRLMVRSEAYSLSSQESAEQRERDPQNRLLSRQSRFRIEAEFVRDQALWVSGLLVDRVGGRSVKPYQPIGYWAHLNFPKRTYQHDEGDEQWRRGLYVHWQRTFLHPSLIAFDAPSREECVAERPISNTPQAALTLLNDPSFVEAARVFAASILAREGDAGARLRWAFQRTTSRPATDAEVAVLDRLLGLQREHYTAHPEEATKLLATGNKPTPEGLDPAEHAAWTAVARALLNLHEAITRS